MAHAATCPLKGCGEKSFGRLRDLGNAHRHDLCKRHLDLTLRHYNMKEIQVLIVEIWGLPATISDDNTSYELETQDATQS